MSFETFTHRPLQQSRPPRQSASTLQAPVPLVPPVLEKHCHCPREQRHE
jgi:hypothetical protein